VQARRQPGSAFKPFIYSGALEAGFTPASVILDAPVVIEGAGLEEMWRPENDSGRFYGPTRLRDALARSRNLVSIRILRAIGVDFAVDYASRFGFAKEQLPRNLTLALGTAQVTPLELTAGYAVFANGGFRVEPYVIDRIEDASGAVLFQADPRIACRECVPEVDANGVPVVAGVPLAAAPTTPPGTAGAAPGDPTAATVGAEPVAPATAGDAGAASTTAPGAPLSALAAERAPPPYTYGGIEAGVTRLADLGGATPAYDAKHVAPQAISAANAWLTTDIMRDVIRRGTATRALALKRSDIAGKTGTTNDRRDTWFAGFNADVVAGAWVGFDQERSLGNGEEGGRTALPVWLYFMGETLAGRPERRLPQPQGIVSARISPTTGELAGANDPDAIFESFLAGRLPGDGGLQGEGAAATSGQQQPASEDRIF
jgi:penicillin-binding protein 1A